MIPSWGTFGWTEPPRWRLSPFDAHACACRDGDDSRHSRRDDPEPPRRSMLKSQLIGRGTRRIRRCRSLGRESTSSALTDALRVGGVAGAIAGILIWLMVLVGFVLEALSCGVSYGWKRSDPVAALPILLIYPLAGAVAAAILDRSSSLVASVSMGMLAMLPMGIAIALSQHGIDKNGGDSWRSALITMAILGGSLGVVGWRRSRRW